jgi:hypothetical protein
LAGKTCQGQAVKSFFIKSDQDVERLTSRLPNMVKNYLVPFEKWNHLVSRLENFFSFVADDKAK